MPALLTGDSDVASEFLRRRMAENRPAERSPYGEAPYGLALPPGEEPFAPETSPLWERAEQQLLDILEGRGGEQDPAEAERLWKMQHAPQAYAAELREKSAKELKDLAVTTKAEEKDLARKVERYNDAYTRYWNYEKEFSKTIQKGEASKGLMKNMSDRLNALSREVESAYISRWLEPGMSAEEEKRVRRSAKEIAPQLSAEGVPLYITEEAKRLETKRRREAKRVRELPIFEMPGPSPFGGREIPGMEEAMGLAAAEAALQAHRSTDPKAVAKAVAEIKASGKTVAERSKAAPAILEKHDIPPAAEAPGVPAGLHRLMEEEGPEFGAEAVSPFGAEGLGVEGGEGDDYGTIMRRLIDQGRAEPEFGQFLKPFEGAGQPSRPGELALSRVPEMMQRYQDRMAAMEGI